jgi:hypothetical protein
MFPILSGKKFSKDFTLHLVKSLEKNGKIGTLVLQLYSNGQFGPSTFKKTNLVPQLLFLGQICPYTDVMLHNTM